VPTSDITIQKHHSVLPYSKIDDRAMTLTMTMTMTMTLTMTLTIRTLTMTMTMTMTKTLTMTLTMTNAICTSVRHQPLQKDVLGQNS
jgi:hypothetical protein